MDQSTNTASSSQQDQQSNRPSPSSIESVVDSLTSTVQSEFDRNFKKFLNICEKILNKEKEGKLDLDPNPKGNPILKCLEQYHRCYLKTKPDERNEMHVVLFLEIYDSNKRSILDDGHKNHGCHDDGIFHTQEFCELGLDHVRSSPCNEVSIAEPYKNCFLNCFLK